MEKKFHGKPTANGETFNMYKVSAAHKTLPLPSQVKVTNLDNNKSLTMRLMIVVHLLKKGLLIYR